MIRIVNTLAILWTLILLLAKQGINALSPIITDASITLPANVFKAYCEAGQTINIQVSWTLDADLDVWVYN